MLKSLVLFAALSPITSTAAEVYDHSPDAIHAKERYVIYSHGLIVEGDEPRPISPKYGQYDFPGIKQAIFSAGGLNLISICPPDWSFVIPIREISRRQNCQARRRYLQRLEAENDTSARTGDRS